ncbi:putative beta-hexosaminidase [Lyophyllum shimeji]|uniref:Beta-hexosaminidase n=1 Tax=Lyophyllum shimeji TaxID=47721 RepID=A0A9P3PMH9_LYOSH|nr:putative beta-hexosaminidase [Lyophyllum shimeji]
MLPLLLISIAIAPCSVLGLWPIPRNLQTGTTLVKLPSTFDIKVDVNNPPQDLLDAVGRTKSYLQTDKLQRLAVGRGANDSAALGTAPTLPSLCISLLNSAPPRPIAVEAVLPIGTRSEGYSLTVPSDGSSAVLTASSTLGLFRGLTTFGQLWYDNSGTTYTYQAPVKIVNDSPAFPYRGFMLDTARNFFPVSDIKRTLDAMSWVKLNTFHWHVVDSQSFPLDIPAFPELASKGAYSSSEIYSAANVKDIVSYAGARGIDVLMEIDTPGHTTAIAASHPEHIACNQASPWSSFANEPPAGQLRLASAATASFTAQLISSIAQTLPSTLFSTGGDELNINCYVRDPQTQADLSKSGRTLEQALNTFTQSTHKALTDLGKTPVVWEEMVLEHAVTLPQNTVVMVWISSQHAAAVTAKNFRIVHGPSDYFYLDCGTGESIGSDPFANSWCDPFKTWQKAYTFDPLANLSTAQQSLVLGGQQLLWTEQSSPENLDSIVWPRAATSAEVFWTGATLPDGTARNVDAALPRLHDIRYRMVRRGVRAIALQPHFCALRPGVCDLHA